MNWFKQRYTATIERHDNGTLGRIDTRSVDKHQISVTCLTQIVHFFGECFERFGRASITCQLYFFDGDLTVPVGLVDGAEAAFADLRTFGDLLVGYVKIWRLFDRIGRTRSARNRLCGRCWANNSGPSITATTITIFKNLPP